MKNKLQHMGIVCGVIRILSLIIFLFRIGLTNKNENSSYILEVSWSEVEESIEGDDLNYI